MAEKGKIVVKTWDFRGKKQIIGTEKLRTGNQIERQNGAKCRRSTRKWTKEETYKTGFCIKSLANYLLFALEVGVQTEVFCKV